MNKKGFTLVELITTFALTAVIVTILINISIMIRNIYNKSEVKTQLLIEQANLSSAINSKINKDNLVDYETCDDSNFCYSFNLKDGDIVKLVIKDSTIKFGDYVYKLSKGTKVENPSISKEAVSITSLDSEFLVIKIPIVNKLYPNEDYGINIVYQYDLDYNKIYKKIGKAVTDENKTPAGNIPQGKFNKGDEYIIDVDGIHKYHFYVLSTEGHKVNLIMSNNICSDGTFATPTNKCFVAWNTKEDATQGPTIAMTAIHNATKYWTNIPNIQIDYTDEGNSYERITTDGSTTKIIANDGTATASYEDLKARLPIYSELEGTGCAGTSGTCPAYMVNGLKSYTSKYLEGVKEDMDGIYGYWSLSSESVGSNKAWYISFSGYIYSTHVGASADFGIRPVITISKYNLS